MSFAEAKGDGLPEGFPRPTIMSGVGPGWWPIVTAIHAALSAIDPDYSVDQVKEKFGTLRYYWSMSEHLHSDEVSADEANVKFGLMQAICDAGEAYSKKVCEE